MANRGTNGGASQETRIWARRGFSMEGSNPLIATVGIYTRCAFVHDLSEGGIGLLITDPPPVGAVVPVWLPRPDGGPSTLLLVAIVHSSPQADGLHRVGGTLIDEASAQAVRAYLGS
jgi:hypothetical protein